MERARRGGGARRRRVLAEPVFGAQRRAGGSRGVVPPDYGAGPSRAVFRVIGGMKVRLG